MEKVNLSNLCEVIGDIRDRLIRIENQRSERPIQAPDVNLLTVDEAAIFLKISKSALYTKVSQREVPVCKRGKRLYFNKADLLKWIQDGRKLTSDEFAANVFTIYKGKRSRHR